MTMGRDERHRLSTWKDRDTFSMGKYINNFGQLTIDKHREGANKYGHYFETEPIAEALEEIADVVNYLGWAQRHMTYLEDALRDVEDIVQHRGQWQEGSWNINDVLSEIMVVIENVKEQRPDSIVSSDREQTEVTLVSVLG